MFRMNGLKLARMNAGITQKELARRLGCSESLVTKWETGRGKPSPEWVELLCKVLNCEPEVISQEALVTWRAGKI